MQIHTALACEGILDISRKYKVLPTKIIADNALRHERLAAGEELLILTPTRQAPVRGGDTLSSLARQYGVKKNALLANNPTLGGEDSLRPGQMLTIKYGAPPLGPASLIGHLHDGTAREKFRTALPYLTYIVAHEYEYEGEGFMHKHDLAKYREWGKDRGGIWLMGFDAKTLRLRSESINKLCEELIGHTKESGYGGIYLVLGEHENTEGLYSAFLLELKRRLIGCELLLFLELSELCDYEVSSFADAAILCPTELNSAQGINNLKQKINIFAEKCETSGAFLSLGACAYQAGVELDIPSAIRLAALNGKVIRLDKTELLLSFDYNRFSRRGKEHITVTYPSLEYIRAEYEHGALCGFMGFSVDISSTPISYFCMFNTLFSRADYRVI